MVPNCQVFTIFVHAYYVLDSFGGGDLFSSVAQVAEIGGASLVFSTFGRIQAAATHRITAGRLIDYGVTPYNVAFTVQWTG